jgi:hypothetical protein
VRRGGAERDQGETGVYRRTAAFLFGSGGAAISVRAAWRRSLARVLGGEVRRGRRFYGRDGLDEGQRTRTESERIRWRFSRSARVHPGLFERDDRWAPVLAMGEGVRGYHFGAGERWATGRFWIQAGFCPRGLFLLS